MSATRRTVAAAGAARPTSQRATPKLRRWTDLIAALLRHHYPVAFDQIAREVPGYDVERRDAASVKRMFERDKRELLRCGVPLETAPDEDGEPTLYTIRRTNFYLPYVGLLAGAGRSAAAASGPRRGRVTRYGYGGLQSLAFEPDGLAAVADAAERVRSSGDPVLIGAAESAMRKLAYDLPVGAAAPSETPTVVPPRARAADATFAVLGDALRDRKIATFDYHAMGSDARARRTVEPYGLFYVSGHWYLAARDQQAGALRNFRLSRMSAVAHNAKRESTADYAVPAEFSLRDHARSRQAWELGDGDAHEATVLFSGDAGAVAAAARLGAPKAGEGDRTRRFTVRRVDVFARWLLSFGGDARPLGPPAVVTEFERQRAATLALYDARTVPE